MNRIPLSLTQMMWLVHKDLTREFRSRSVFPAMIMMGWAVVLVLALQLDLPQSLQIRVTGTMLWMAVFFAGVQTWERSFTAERDEGCWDALCLYPVPAAAVYGSKLLFNWLMLTLVTAILVPAFVVLTGAPLLNQWSAMTLVVVLANVGLAAVGTLISGLTQRLLQRGQLLVLILLPLDLPVLLAASDATRLIAEGPVDIDFWRWTKLLAAFGLLFVTVGLLLFEFITEG